MLAGCGSSESAPSAQQRAVIVGSDDRVEVYAAPADTQSSARSVAALIHAQHLIFDQAGAGRIAAPTAGDALDLCPSERFADEPVAAYCSGVLIDDTLLATAAHCLGTDLQSAEQRCSELRVAFGYDLEQPDVLPVSLPATSIFACRSVVLFEHAAGDFAVIELDRAASADFAVATIAPTRPRVDDALVVIGAGAGLPLKIDAGARVTDAPAEGSYFTASSDTFAGDSGGGVFNAQHELVGLVEGGGTDWEAADGCTHAAHVDVSVERHQFIDALVAALSQRAVPSAHDSAPRCGDGLCELSERAACQTDCHAYDAVPSSWLGEPETGLLMVTASTNAPQRSANGGCAFGARSVANGWFIALIVGAFAALRGPLRPAVRPKLNERVGSNRGR